MVVTHVAYYAIGRVNNRKSQPFLRVTIYFYPYKDPTERRDHDAEFQLI